MYKRTQTVGETNQSYVSAGRKMLDVQGTERAISLVWGIINQGSSCFQVATNSKLSIQEDPWLPSIPSFRIPNSVVIPPNLQFVRHLMNCDGSAWDDRKVSAVFSPSIGCKILQTPYSRRGA